MLIGMKLGDRGSEVELLQYILNLIGINVGRIDGAFGNNTKKALAQFQENNGIEPTGVIEQQTYDLIEPYILGYKKYVIKDGDTLASIANSMSTNVDKILTANPRINPIGLQKGDTIIVPLGYDVVKTDISYTYEIMEKDIQGLLIRYPFLKVGSIGKSVEGRDLFSIKLGMGNKRVTYNGSHHANEWITTPVLMKWVEQFLQTYTTGGKMKGYDVAMIWNSVTIDIIPMVNPDGVDLVIDGVQPDDPRYNELVEWNRGNTDFSKWKANIKGVDINRNYDAGWEEYKEIEQDFGVDGPGPALYGGEYPVSEPETQAMVDFTSSAIFRLVIAYHTQGQVIFWEFMDLQPPVSYEIGKQFADVTGYTLAEPAEFQSYAGYKDWFIKEFRRPGYTFEVGKGINPLPISQFDKIYEDNEEVLLLAALV